MKKFFQLKPVAVTGVVLGVFAIFYQFFHQEAPVDFSSEVKPVLNKKCISCHGGVKAQGGFSVLFRDEALAVTESGKPAIIPGDPDGSEMIKRLVSNDPETRMPYKHEPLDKEEIDLLRRWIKQGAKWGDHWAYLPVKETPAPDLDNDWIRNDVDRFIFRKLEDNQLRPSPEADKATLLRRVSLDLIGTYPTDAVAKKFLESKSDKAYEELVDTLLASKRFGERWASLWLDISRYADTKGYESDNGRTIWRYRDWLIDAFNADQPYDRFITDQIAGDLLPNPTDNQYIATAFSRNTMNNDEGGTDNEEFRVAAVMDRVNTTWESLMSTTFACVQCHSHPYDPFKHDEYYKFMAFFNNSRDEDIPADYPLLREFKNDTLRHDYSELTQWIKAHGTESDARKLADFVKTWQPSINMVSADSLHNGLVLNKNTYLALSNHGRARLKKVNLEGAGQMIWNFRSKFKSGTLTLTLDSPTGPTLAKIAIEPKDTWRREFVHFPRQSGIHDVYLHYENRSVAKDNSDFLLDFDWMGFLPAVPESGGSAAGHYKKMFEKLVTTNEVTNTPVMVENPSWLARPTHVFERGNRLTLGKEVSPEVPHSLSFSMPEGTPKNRLGLAQWLTDKRNPLVSRTMVNRIWEQLFGVGIVETLEDMGTQGTLPTHKDLLDHLSWEFMNDQKWSTKTLLKQLVMSATYRQDSRLSPEIAEKDPSNKWYARGPRTRLTAEQVRDQALSISGVLSNKMYGPGVMPWQPEGIWLSPYNRAKWINSQGEDQYRRAVYTYWKRTAPYPSMITFDGVPRVLCTARRIRTNTPLQALVTLNDSAYLDMARHFAHRMEKEGGATLAGQLGKGYQLMLFKPLQPNKQKVFETLYQKAVTEFSADTLKTRQMLGSKSVPAKPQSAALVVVANAMLNLDEVVTKN